MSLTWKKPSARRLPPAPALPLEAREELAAARRRGRRRGRRRSWHRRWRATAARAARAPELGEDVVSRLGLEGREARGDRPPGARRRGRPGRPARGGGAAGGGAALAVVAPGRAEIGEKRGEGAEEGGGRRRRLTSS